MVRSVMRVLRRGFLLALIVLSCVPGRVFGRAVSAQWDMVAGSTPALMPPHPDVLARVRRGELSLPAYFTDPDLRQQMGIDQPQPLDLQAGPTWHTIALLVRFTDNPSQVGAVYFDTLLFGGGMGTLTDYYAAVSYGALDIVTVNLPSGIGWLTAPQTYAYYVDGAYGTGAYPRNAQRLAEDAVWMADPVVDFSNYDNDGDGWVDTVFIIHAGQGAEATGDVDDIWSHSWSTLIDPYVDGVRVNSYTTEPEYWYNPGDMTVGVYAHELGHALGLPDLYDTDSSSEGVGDWSLMAGGSWNGTMGNRPAFLDAWSRVELGFVTPTDVTADLLGATIPAAETSTTVYRLWTQGSIGSQYFLVENRQLTSYDVGLPGAGLLIWHVDETRSGNTRECRQVNNWLCGSNHYKVALEQADGLMDLEYNRDRGDAGDPYPGSTGKRTFTFVSAPNSSAYTHSADTLVRVDNISSSGGTMTADLIVGVAGNQPPLTPENPLPANGATGQSLTVDLHWKGGDPDTGDTVTYDVYLAAGDPTPDALICDDVALEACDPGALAEDTLYYWTVVATDNHGAATPGPVWSFTTETGLPPSGVVIDSYTIDDDVADQSSGNGNGVVECGERIELYVSLLNEGSETATTVIGGIESTDPYVTWLANTSSGYPNLRPGVVRANYNDFELDVAPATPDGHVIHFDLTVTASNGGPWMDGFDVVVSCGGGGNQPPYVPASPAPADGATGQSVDADLGWVGGDPDAGDTVAYDVYLAAGDPTPDTLVCADVATAACDPGALAEDTRYYWTVVATDNHGALTAGPTWSFTTEGGGAPSGVVVNSHTIDDDALGQSNGNGDGVVQCGERIELFVSLLNLDPATYSLVSAVIQTADPYVTWLMNTSSGYPNLRPGAARANYNDFELDVAPTTPDGHIIHFDLTATASNGGPWMDGFDVVVVCGGGD